MYYELHVTMLTGIGEPEARTKYIRWKYSAIDSDPDLGEGVRCYATKHVHASVPVQTVIGILEEAMTRLSELGCCVVRGKVEHILYDRRKK